MAAMALPPDLTAPVIEAPPTEPAKTSETDDAGLALRLRRKPTAEEHTAASMIQRNFRGYRGRREMKGMGLDASTRWIEAVKEAQYRNATGSTSRHQRATSGQTKSAAEVAQSNWRRVGAVAVRVGGDDTSDTDGSPSMTAEQLEAYRRRKREAKREREKHAKMMDVSYYLEMVDAKHRYGSHLRAYHAEWKKADTNENFFFWLDHGEGRHVEIPTVSREKLEADQIRYLSREERQNYLVRIDKQGRLCWAKNGLSISTDREWRDSINGIVPNNDSEAPCWHHDETRSSDSDSSASSETSSASHRDHAAAEEEARHYTNDELKKARGLKKLQKVNAGVILNHLLQKSVKPGTWIFVSDTSFRLYVGIKQSGAFQHSSFLHGARISAAGLIKIKDGQLRRLSPLSGHYRPPTRNFREFVRSLKLEGVDMSRVSISRSYTVLLGLEAYQKSSKKLKHGERKVGDGVEWLVHPDEARRREEEAREKSKSAQLEREHLERLKTEREEERRRKGESLSTRFWRRFSIGTPKDKAKERIKQRKKSVDGADTAGQVAKEPLPT